MNEELKALRDAPLADPLKIHLPQGKGRAKRGKKAEYYSEDLPRLTRKELAELQERAVNAKVKSILDYYATTQVPFDRIAAHVGMSVERVAESMKWRGRAV